MERLCTKCLTRARPRGPTSRIVYWLLAALMLPVIAVGWKLLMLGGVFVLFAAVPLLPIFVALALTRPVLCPACGEPRPIPLGSPRAKQLLEPPR